MSLLGTVAGQLALALQRVDSEAATERMAGQMATLYDLGLETAALRDLRPLFVKAAEEAGRLIRADHSSVFRLRARRGWPCACSWPGRQDPGDGARRERRSSGWGRASPAGWPATSSPPS